jgi:hypothetical protein
MKWLLIILAMSCEARDLRWEYAKRGNQDVTSGLVAQWKANGDTVDNIGGNNGTFMFGEYYDAGKKDQAFSFVGTNRIDATRNTSVSYSSNFTVCAWVYPLSTTGGVWAAAQSASNRIGFVYKALTPCFTYWNGAKYTITNAAAISTNTWNHLVGVCADGNLSIYVNGISSPAGSSVSQSLAETLVFDVGRTRGSSAPDNVWMNGLIDDVRIYNRALSPAEVLKVYRSPK